MEEGESTNKIEVDFVWELVYNRIMELHNDDKLLKTMYEIEVKDYDIYLGQLLVSFDFMLLFYVATGLDDIMISEDKLLFPFLCQIMKKKMGSNIVCLSVEVTQLFCY